MKAFATMQLGELCQRLGIPSRQARYVLEEKLLPRGVDPTPDRGNHRQLTPAQVFWLGIVLKLKESGIRTPLAAQIAEYARQAVRGISRGLNWDPRFLPFDGELVTEHQWFLELGDLKYIRLVTDCCPSQDGLHEFDWTAVGQLKHIKGVMPVVVVRVDLTRLAEMLRK